MPKCDGLPEDGRCPQNVNNRSVKPSQGELMLCPSCEAIRFPYIRANAGSAAQQTATKKAQSVNKKRSASTSKGTDIGKNGAVIPERQYSKSDDEDECVFVVMPSLLRLTAFAVIYANMRTIKPALVCHLMYLLLLLPSSPRPDGSAGNVASSLTV